MRSRNSLVFLWAPLIFNLAVIAMYFSGVKWLQNIIAPTMETLAWSSWREFGLLEMVQNALLAGVVCLFATGIRRKQLMLEKLTLFFGLCVIAFLLLEEIDYGAHLYNYFGGEGQWFEHRNLHNQWTEQGLETATIFKRIADAATVLLFVLLPLIGLVTPAGRILGRLRIGSMRLLPNPWFIVACLVAFICSRLAHHLDDQQFDMINGVRGNLTDGIAEFRETTTYYVFLLYAMQLVSGFFTDHDSARAGVPKPDE